MKADIIRKGKMVDMMITNTKLLVIMQKHLHLLQSGGEVITNMKLLVIMQKNLHLLQSGGEVIFLAIKTIGFVGLRSGHIMYICINVVVILLSGRRLGRGRGRGRSQNRGTSRGFRPNGSNQVAAVTNGVVMN